MAKYWYAVVTDNNGDWGYGSFDYEEAMRMAEAAAKSGNYDQVDLVTIDNGDDPVAVDEISVYLAERDDDSKKITLYTAEQGVWGADAPSIIYFRNREDRDEYVKTHDYSNKSETIKVSPSELEKMEYADIR